MTRAGLAATASLAIATVMLAACDGPDPVAKDADDAAALPAPPTSDASDPSGSPPPPNASRAPRPDDGTTAKSAASLPAALHGRWGLTPADCGGASETARGRLTITGSEVQFHESTAVPVGNTQSSADSFSGDFAFTGEGMRWTRFQTFERQGEKLVRTESTPMASYTYARCR